MNYAVSDGCKMKFIDQIRCWHGQMELRWLPWSCSSSELGSPSLQQGSRTPWSRWKRPLTSRDFASCLGYFVFCQHRSPCALTCRVVTRSDPGEGLEMHPQQQTLYFWSPNPQLELVSSHLEHFHSVPAPRFVCSLNPWRMLFHHPLKSLSSCLKTETILDEASSEKMWL